MSKSLVLAFAFAASVVAAAPSARAASVLTLGPSSLCGASGCFGQSHTFKQTFSAADHGVVDVSSLSLFRGIVGDMQNYAVRVSFELADGTKVGSWGAFTVSVLNGEFVTLGGEAFTWDAATMGDLVLTLDLLVPEKGGGGFGGGGNAFARAASLSMPFISRPGPVFAPNDHEGDGPVGGSLVDSIRTAVPEPASWALMIAGFAGSGLMLRRRALAV